MWQHLPQKNCSILFKGDFFQRKGICKKIFQLQKIVSPFNDFLLQKMSNNDFICVKK